MKFRKEFAERLKIVMNDRNCDVKRLSEITEIDDSQIYRYLREETEPRLSQFGAIAVALDCSADFLLGLVPYESDLSAKK